MPQNLLGVTRSVIVYDNKSEEQSKEVRNDRFIAFEVLKGIVPPPSDDPLLYEGYVLTNSQLEAINSYLLEEIAINFDVNYYVLECFGVYDWSSEQEKASLL
jgi:hypothetical protein